MDSFLSENGDEYFETFLDMLDGLKTRKSRIEGIRVLSDNSLSKEEKMKLLIKISQSRLEGYNNILHGVFDDLFTYVDFKYLKKHAIEGKDYCGCESVLKMASRLLFNKEMKESKELPEFHSCLFYGPPGCGKTTCTKALAGEHGYSLIIVECRILSKCFSAKLVTSVFKKGREVEPCIILFKEFGTLFSTNTNSEGRKSSGDTLSLRLTAGRIRLLEELKRLKSEVNKRVVFIASAYRPDMIDVAFLRSESLALKVFFPLPNQAMREQLLRLYLRGERFGVGVDLARVAQLTVGFECCEIKTICSRVKRLSVMQFVEKAKEKRVDCERNVILPNHFEQVMRYRRGGDVSGHYRRYEEFAKRMEGNMLGYPQMDLEMMLGRKERKEDYYNSDEVLVDEVMDEGLYGDDD